MSAVGDTKESEAAKLVTFLPAITVAALLILAIFNIGYFSKIGLHFLGVMDFTNLVYSFSFVVAMLTGSLGVYFWGDYLERLLKHAGDARGKRKIAWVIGIFVAIVLIAVVTVQFFFPQYAPKHFLTDRLTAMAFILMAAFLLAVLHANYKKTKQVGIGNGFYAFVVAVLALYYLGRAVAEHEIYTVKTTYTFAIKESEPIV